MVGRKFYLGFFSSDFYQTFLFIHWDEKVKRGFDLLHFLLLDRFFKDRLIPFV